MAHHGQGGHGTRYMVVRTNSFVMTVRNPVLYHQYTVAIIPEPKPNNARRRSEIIDKLSQQYPGDFKKRPIFDGMAKMYSAGIEYKSLAYEIFLGDRAPIQKTPGKNIFSVKIQKVHQIDSRLAQRLLTSNTQEKFETFSRIETLTALQISVRQAPSMRHGFSSNKASFFVDPAMMGKPSQDLTGGAVMWAGFHQSVRPVTGRFIINVDVTHAAMYKSGRAIDIALELTMTINLGHSNRNPEIRQLYCEEGSPVFRMLRSHFKGLAFKASVSMPEITTLKRGRKASGIVPYGGEHVFDGESGRTTVAEYFRRKYNREIKYPKAIGIMFRDAVYPIEVLDVVPGQFYKKKLSEEQTRQFMTRSEMKPAERLQRVQSAVSGPNQILDYDQSDYMQDAGLYVEKTPLEINGKLLPPPAISYSKDADNVIARIADREGKWNVTQIRRFHTPIQIGHFVVISFTAVPDDRPGNSDQERFVNQLCRNLVQLGIYTPNKPPMLQRGNPTNPLETLKAVQRACKSRPSFLLVILPKQAAAIRKTVKNWSTCEVGIPTQCVRDGKYNSGRGEDQYCNNVALKIHSKIGGINSAAKSAAMSKFASECIMVVGCDVSHPAPGVRDRPSIASLVASIDPFATKYQASIRVQEPRQETIEELYQMLNTAIEYFFHLTNKVPTRLVVFRDGVSEGEYEQVARKEIQAIQELFKNNNFRVGLTFIVVTKRHHVRFFPRPHDPSADRSGNCPAGFIVDSDIVYSTMPDFYLQSHSGIKGTSRPSHYTILQQDPFWTVEQLQELSFGLCHNYAAATRSVSIPAPVYYADKACTFADFMFDSNFNLEETSTHTSDQPFNLEAWKKAYQRPHNDVFDKLFFL